MIRRKDSVMFEESKWQKELPVFARLVNTIVLTGNISDQYPIINEKEQCISGYCELDRYLAWIAQRSGYQSVICYDPVDGFHGIQGTKFSQDVLAELKRLAKEELNTQPSQTAGSQAPEGREIHLTEKKDKYGVGALLTDNFEEAAHAVKLLLTRCSFSVSVIMNCSSRMMARPDDLDVDERMIFLYLLSGAAGAKTQKAGDPKSPNYASNPVIRNQLYLIADKLNDLPAWYSMTHPGLRNINIPKPDYRMREEIIKGFSASFPGYSDASEEEKRKYIEKFVGSSDGFTTRDISRVVQAARFNRLDIRGIDKAILLYKHGVQENPWLKLDRDTLAVAEERIRERVLGQDHVVSTAVDVVKRAAMGMSGLQHSGSSSKPRGILFLAGPTGTGKTELAKALTQLIFLDERNMIRFDMSEYRQEQSDQRLLGAPPGYVGYEAGGQLTNAVREHPFSVLLFDEIEKAHPSILDKFLQILEDGRITDGRGDTVYFQDCLIIFTSNLGMTIPSPENPQIRLQNVSFDRDKDPAAVKEKILAGVKHYFNEEIGRPELLNRIGNNILVFDFIRENSVLPILKKQIRNIAANLLSEKNIRLTVGEGALEDLRQMAVADLPKAQGGRGIGNMMEEAVLNPLSRYMFDNGVMQDADLCIEHIFRTGSAVDMRVRITG